MPTVQVARLIEVSFQHVEGSLACIFSFNRRPSIESSNLLTRQNKRSHVASRGCAESSNLGTGSVLPRYTRLHFLGSSCDLDS